MLPLWTSRSDRRPARRALRAPDRAPGTGWLALHLQQPALHAERPSVAARDDIRKCRGNRHGECSSLRADARGTTHQGNAVERDASPGEEQPDTNIEHPQYATAAEPESG